MKIFKLISIFSLVVLVISTYSMERERANLSKKEILNTLLEQKATQEALEQKSTKVRRSHPSSEPYYKKTYTWTEENFDALKEELQPYEVAGGVDYFMTFNEIVEQAKAKLQKMYKEGKIITESQFNKLNKDEWFYKGYNLTRIWGAQHLAKIFFKNVKEAVPNYIIVVKDPNDLQINITYSACFPVIYAIQNGTIYAKNIIGKPVATKAIGSYVGPGGYTDYSAPDNIIQTAEGIKYYVDTEYKSFYDGNPGKYLYNNPNIPSQLLFCEYLKERFKLVNNLKNTEKVVKISLNP